MYGVWGLGVGFLRFRVYRFGAFRAFRVYGV